ncbi:hypothetical protein MBLNU230_g2213t1 [Neophaeotheca triangularis]
MSYMRAQPNGSYRNGNGPSDQFRRFDFGGDSSRDVSDNERSQSRGAGRNGGYGEQTEERRVRGPTRLDRGHAQRRSRDETWSASRSRSRPAASGNGGASSQVEEILRYIEQQWSFMASDSCIPIKVALQLMDESSLGLADQYDQFQEVHQQLQNALKVIVNEHHQGFNSSIGTFHKIQAAIHSSQQRVRTLRAGLVQAKGNLATTKPELQALAQDSQGHDQMLQVLGSIEELQLVPERLEAQISEKRFLGAVDTLLEALKLIRKPDMEEIGALSELRVYLSNQEISLTDILVEELHSHLYLRSPYCEERWRSHTRRDATITNLDSDERAMFHFLQSYDGSAPMQEDTARNPEADTFYYIQLLVESLNRLMKLDVAVDQIEHRMPVELFRVVERSHTEVEQRHPAMMRSAARNKADKQAAKEGIGGESRATLDDLLTTLYAKFEAIAEGHRVLHDVTGAILKREAQADAATLNRSFRELWKLLQSEIRSLLHDHLATNGQMGQGARQENNPTANIFKPHVRDRKQRLFKMNDTDSKSVELATEREDLEFILKSSVPGLVSSNTQSTKKNRETNDLPDRSATGHKLLVEPSVFNMGILLPPSLEFLHKLREVVPTSSGVVPSTLTSFLDDFLINVFYPQLEETLIDLCSRIMNEVDSFQPDPAWQQRAKRPIFKGTARFYDLMETFCKMLDSLPHDQSFSSLLIAQMRTVYDRCYNWSKALLSRAQMAEENQQGMRLAANLATNGQVNDTVIELLKDGEKDAAPLAEKESVLLLGLTKNHPLTEADLITDRKSLAALCTLHSSMKWLASRCQQLRYISPRAVDTSNMQPQDSRRWTMNTANDPSAPSNPFIPLDEEHAARFDAVIMSFTELSTLILRTLHIDLRLQLIHGIHGAMSSSYNLGQPYDDPDPAILTLSSSLSTYCTALTTNFLAKQQHFISLNLHVLANAALTSLTPLIAGMDYHGNNRMQLNLLVLQQCVKQFEPAADLGRAARFYELGQQGPEAVVKANNGSEFGREELRGLIRLCWDAERDGSAGGLDDWLDRLE